MYHLIGLMQYLVVDESFQIYGKILDRCSTLEEALTEAQGCDSNVTVIEVEEVGAELVPTGRRWDMVHSLIP
jgi:hypothetical protein